MCWRKKKFGEVHRTKVLRERFVASGGWILIRPMAPTKRRPWSYYVRGINLHASARVWELKAFGGNYINPTPAIRRPRASKFSISEDLRRLAWPGSFRAFGSRKWSFKRSCFTRTIYVSEGRAAVHSSAGSERYRACKSNPIKHYFFNVQLRCLV